LLEKVVAKVSAFIKKIISRLPPKNIIYRYLRRICAFLLMLCIMTLVAVFTMNAAIKHSVEDRIISVDEAIRLDDIDCVLVLGAGLRQDGTPSDMLSDRLDIGIELYNGMSVKLLFSGDHATDEYNEVGAMKTYAMDESVASEDIFLDHAGFSTYESIYRAKEKFGADKIIIVTQGYHIYRALYIAKQLGIDAYGVPSDQRTYVGQTYRDAREVIARFKDFFYVQLKKTPTNLGVKISLDGNGEITDN